MRRVWGLFLPFCRRLPLARTLCGACNRANIAAACAAKKQKKCTLSFIFKDLTTKERILSNLPGGRKNILLACHILSQLRPPRKRFNGGICRALKICPQNGDICTFAKYYVTHKRQFFAFSAAFYRRHTAGVRTVVRARHPPPATYKTEVPEMEGWILPYPVNGAPVRAPPCGGSPNCGSVKHPLTPHTKQRYPKWVPLFCGGRGWIRTTEVGDVRFTV